MLIFHTAICAGASQIATDGRRELDVLVATPSLRSGMEIKMDIRRIAHRGLSAWAPENTEVSFRLATECDCFGIECDIWRTIDGVYVVSHDDSMKKMFGVKKHITESSYEDIKDLPVISGNLVTESPTQHICTLQRYLHVVEDSDKYAFIEIKQDLDVGFLNEIISVVNSYDMYERTFFISSEAKTLLRLRYDLSFPKERLQYVHGAKARDSHVPVNEALITRLVAHGIGLDARHSLLDEKFVDELHDVGQSVNVWTVDTEKDFKKVVEKYGVDMVTMNDVRAMV